MILYKYEYDEEVFAFPESLYFGGADRHYGDHGDRQHKA